MAGVYIDVAEPAPEVDLVEVTLPSNPDLPNEAPEILVQMPTGRKKSKRTPSNKPKPRNGKSKKLQPDPLPIEIESPGLALLSHLCELSSNNINIQNLAFSCAGVTNYTTSTSQNVHVQFIPQLNEVEIVTPSCITIDSRPSSAYDTDIRNTDSPKDIFIPHQQYEINVTSQESQTKTRKKKNVSGASRATKALKFPPCSVCGGTASGLHYGVNSCEACKGFFRRFLLRSEEYKCVKGGNCEIINRNRGNCAGCRLKKCLLLGMAKEKSKLGRYTLAKRTETILEVNKLEGKDSFQSFQVNASNLLSVKKSEEEKDPNAQCGMISRKMSENLEDIVLESAITDTVIAVLITKIRELKPFGLDVETEEEIQEALKKHHEVYMNKVELYGTMKAIPKEEFFKVYADHGIDLDDRMMFLKGCEPHLDRIVGKYCEFAKNLPYFLFLSTEDQSNLLKVSRSDWFMVVMHKGYSREYNTFIGYDGKPRHFEESVDKFFTRKLLVHMCKIYTKIQDLNLCDEEVALLGALVILSPDRCVLENPALVEEMQLNVAECLKREFKKRHPADGSRRFTKAIDCITEMRECSDMYLQEYNELCKEKVLVEEMPVLSEFVVENA